jgi:hypothetical protein
MILAVCTPVFVVLLRNAIPSLPNRHTQASPESRPPRPPQMLKLRTRIPNIFQRLQRYARAALVPRIVDVEVVEKWPRRWRVGVFGSHHPRHEPRIPTVPVQESLPRSLMSRMRRSWLLLDFHRRGVLFLRRATGWCSVLKTDCETRRGQGMRRFQQRSRHTNYRSGNSAPPDHDADGQTNSVADLGRPEMSRKSGSRWRVQSRSM